MACLMTLQTQGSFNTLRLAGEGSVSRHHEGRLIIPRVPLSCPDQMRAFSLLSTSGLEPSLLQKQKAQIRELLALGQQEGDKELMEKRKS